MFHVKQSMNSNLGLSSSAIGFHFLLFSALDAGHCSHCLASPWLDLQETQAPVRRLSARRLAPPVRRPGEFGFAISERPGAGGGRPLSFRHGSAGAASHAATPARPRARPRHRRLHLRLSRFAAGRAGPDAVAAQGGIDRASRAFRAGPERGSRCDRGLGFAAGQSVRRRENAMACSACGTAKDRASTAPATSSSTPTRRARSRMAACWWWPATTTRRKSSTVAHQIRTHVRRQRRSRCSIRASVQEILDFGLHGWAMSPLFRTVGRDEVR